MIKFFKINYGECFAVQNSKFLINENHIIIANYIRAWLKNVLCA